MSSRRAFMSGGGSTMTETCGACSGRQRTYGLSDYYANKETEGLPLLSARRWPKLHGGAGMTNELEVGKLFKRATVLERIYGCTEDHLLRYSAAQHNLHAMKCDRYVV